jgi:hypothetical protein
MRVEEAMNVSMEKWLSGIPREQLETYIETVEKLAKLPTDFEKG